MSPLLFNDKYNTYSFETGSHSDFKKLTHIFLITKEMVTPGESLPTRKGISSLFRENKISKISLSYWFMGDGGLLPSNKDYIRKGLLFKK